MIRADWYVTVRFRADHLWDHDDPGATKAAIEKLLRDEGLFGCVDHNWEMVSVEKIASDEELPLVELSFKPDAALVAMAKDMLDKGHGNQYVTPVAGFSPPEARPVPVKRSMVRLLGGSFVSKGTSHHSGGAQTVWATVLYCVANGVPFEVRGRSGVGYVVKKL